jgi:fatty-acyl-CoA synthase
MPSPRPGSRPSAFLPSYGLAEATLAVTIMPPGEGIMVELVEEDAFPAGTPREGRPQRYRAIVNCGKPVKDMVVEIRGEDGSLLGEPDRQGMVHRPIPHAGLFPRRRGDCRLHGGRLARHRRHGLYVQMAISIIVGRAKDMIIINGKNHWPQDIEWAVEQLPGFKQGDIAAFAITTPMARRRPQCSSIAASDRIPNAPSCATRSATRCAPSPA